MAYFDHVPFENAASVKFDMKQPKQVVHVLFIIAQNYSYLLSRVLPRHLLRRYRPLHLETRKIQDNR